MMLSLHEAVLRHSNKPINRDSGAKWLRNHPEEVAEARSLLDNGVTLQAVWEGMCDIGFNYSRESLGRFLRGARK
jgi:hypothetical protein